jgi:hypothetical protein
MSRYIFMVMTNASEGQDEAFNAWYTNKHLPDVFKIDGYVSAQRFKLIPKPGTPCAHRYLALYEVETNDLAKTHAALAAASGTDVMPWDPAFDSSSVIGWYFEPITERLPQANTG